MSKYTKQDIIRIVEEEDVEFIRLQFTDMFGTLKNVAITSSQLEKALNNECMFDGSSIEGFVRIEESDMYLYPDLDTFVIFPWRPQQGKVARIICDIYTADRKPFEGDPRYALKKAVADAESMGYRFDVGPECEFFLFNQDEDGQPTTMSTERAGYFDLGPVDLGENARRDMVLTLEDMGYEIEASHHEVAPAQHEIDFKYDEALKTADNIMTFKLAVKTIAKRHGMFASFMPKPKYGVNGSGMHVNMSLSKEGRNIFDDPDGENGLSREAYWFIGGIMNHMRAMTAITNPLVNSYKRLVPGYEAPIYIAWSMTNRSPLIRIPVSRGSRTRVELRCPDSAANLKPVNARKHHIQQRHLHIRVVIEPFQRFFAGFGLHHIITGALEVNHHKAADTGFIFQDQYFFHIVYTPFPRCLLFENHLKSNTIRPGSYGTRLSKRRRS